MISKRSRPSIGAGLRPSLRGLVLPRHWSNAALLCLLAGTAACVEPEAGARAAEPPPQQQQIARLAIDTGAELQLEPGVGVGVAVAYEGEGTWRVSTACDTAVTGATCQFDVVVSSGGEDELLLLEEQEPSLEPRDDVFYLDPFALELLLETGDDLDAVAFSASPDAVLRLTVWLYDPVVDSGLDWTRDPRLISWVGHGAVNWGAPTNPLELEPAGL